MKRISLLSRELMLVILAAICLTWHPAQSAALHQVYLLPMAGGLDQYLADWITREKIAQIVTDPKAADLVMTDRLGEDFEQKMAQLRPEPVKPEPVKDEPPKDAKKDDKSDPKAPKTMESAGAGTAANAPHNAFHSSTLRGTLFLVDIKSKQVVWSNHEKPPVMSDANLNREAERIAKKLQLTFAK
jgi:hypothetical protein